MINHIKQTEMERLVTATRQSDERAFEELVRMYQHLAHGYAFALLKDIYPAQDAVQDSFPATYYQLHSLKNIAGIIIKTVLRELMLRIQKYQNTAGNTRR